MRSARESSQAGDQQCLPFEVPPRAPTVRRPGLPLADGPGGTRSPRYRLRDDALASHGWPAGTELAVDEGRRPHVGQVALVREGGRLKIGVFDRRLGRGVLRTDRGEQWLGASARFVGVVTLAGPPLEGMPQV